jgi:hypothetical protein
MMAYSVRLGGSRPGPNSIYLELDEDGGVGITAYAYRIDDVTSSQLLAMIEFCSEALARRQRQEWIRSGKALSAPNPHDDHKFGTFGLCPECTDR